MKKLLIGTLSVLMFILIFLVYSGLFSKISIQEMDLGPFDLAYEDHVGNYSDAGKIFSRMYDTIEKDFSIKPERSFGIYLDDPRTVPAEKLRSELGFIIDEKDAGRMDDLKTRFKVRKLERKKYAAVLFPYRNPISIFIGIMRVYTPLAQYIKDKGYKTEYGLEIYDRSLKRTTYAFTIK